MTKSKLNGTEKKISKTLIDSDISHGDFTLMISREQIYFKRKESIRADVQLGNIEWNRLMEHNKSIGQGEKQYQKLKT